MSRLDGTSAARYKPAVIITARSIAIGLAGFASAFLIAWLSKINPVHLNPMGVAALLLSTTVGLPMVLLTGKRLCQRDSERASAVMVFATSWFVGIYTPITAIWINAPFYAWAIAQTAKPKPEMLRAMLIPALEKTSWTHYLGALVLIMAWYSTSKRAWNSERGGGTPRPAFVGKLSWADGTFGVMAFVAGLIQAMGGEDSRLTGLAQWIGYICGAFLLCLLFRSFRLERSELEIRLPEITGQLMTRRAGAGCVAGFGLCCGSFLLVTRWDYLTDHWGLAVLAVPMLAFQALWLLFCRIIRHPSGIVAERRRLIGQFAVRCGTWCGVATTLMFAGWLLTGIAKNELTHADRTPTPFALTVLAMKPLFCISILPAIGGWFGGLLIPWVLPRTVRASERILATLQQAGVAALVSLILLVPNALSLASCVTPSVEAARGLSQEMPSFVESHIRSWLVEGKWISLGCLDTVVIVALMVNITAFSVGQAIIECGLTWLKNRVRRY